MRLAAAALAVMLLTGATAAAQTSSSPYGLDPYSPSDAFWLRNYGAALVAQTPLLELRTLDPYKPSHAALIRQIGGAMPLWGVWWYPASALPMPAPLSPLARSDRGHLQRPLVDRGGFSLERIEAELLAQPPLSEVLASQGLGRRLATPRRGVRVTQGAGNAGYTLLAGADAGIQPGARVTGPDGALYDVVGTVTAADPDGQRRVLAVLEERVEP